MYNSVARRAERLATFTEQRRFWAKSHAWFTKNRIPWWFAPMCCLLACSANVLGGATSNCERLRDAADQAFARCDNVRHTISKCEAILYSEQTDEEINACVDWLGTAPCELVNAGDICNARYIKL